MSRFVPASLGLALLLLVTPTGAQPRMHGPALPESVTHGHVCAELRSFTREIIDGPDAPRGPSPGEVRLGTAPSLAGGSLQRIEDSSEQRSLDSELQTVITPLTGWELHLQSGEGLRRNDARAAMARDEAAATPRRSDCFDEAAAVTRRRAESAVRRVVVSWP